MMKCVRACLPPSLCLASFLGTHVYYVYYLRIVTHQNDCSSYAPTGNIQPERAFYFHPTPNGFINVRVKTTHTSSCLAR